MPLERPIFHTGLEVAQEWVHEMQELCRPDSVCWCDGSEAEKERIEKEAIASGELETLDPRKWPGCFYHRSNKNDVARTEELTFICTRRQIDSGPTNNWMAPEEAYRRLKEISRDSMRGRTMFVVPFLMGPASSPFRKIGVEITDSRYVVLSMRIMTRMGDAVMKELKNGESFTKCMHGLADINPQRRLICHFPEDHTIWSVGSGYGGNALLGKKCLALRIGSYLGKLEGWLAEHMLIIGVENPQREIKYIAAALPSQCGKTNLAMLIPPKTMPGYRVWTLGDDIAWLRIGPDGRLWAQNPEAGFFGVAPGTTESSNPNAMATIRSNSIFTNVLRTDDGGVWWEGLPDPPTRGKNWVGEEWTPGCGKPAAHPNSRFTAPARQCPSISPSWETPQGVPLSAIFFGARRANLVPLICESFSWRHGVYLGATMASETTAAATGKVGVVRRDPMAMLPFIGYNVGDYFAHWLEIGERLGDAAPKIFKVNWFRKNPQTGEFLWPGFGENLRAVLWALDRCGNKAGAQKTPLGFVPRPEDLNLEGLNVPRQNLDAILSFQPEGWKEDLADQRAFFAKIGDRLPPVLRQEQDAFAKRLGI
jgi:phosphoenolpyruvate carboxykinase (GTP)